MDFILCEILVDFIDTPRHVVVCLVEEITTFLLLFKELVSSSSGFFSSLVRLFLGFRQAGLNVFEPFISHLSLIVRQDLLLNSLGIGIELLKFGSHPSNFRFEFTSDFL